LAGAQHRGPDPCPGASFFADGTGQHTARLNFSNATPERIDEGVRRLARCLAVLIARHQA